MARVKSDLTNEQKIEIIQGAQKILGSKGQNWIKGTWFGKKEPNFVPGGFRYVNTSEDPFDRHHNWRGVQPADADCWCLLGALEESAFRLGYSSQRRQSAVVGRLTSLKALAKNRVRDLYGHVGKTDPVHVYNDAAKVTWKDVKKLMDERIKQLREAD